MRRKPTKNYLKRCRKAQGLTQKEVAWILGLESSSMISRWEKGVSLPETLNALKMAALYQTTVDFVFEDLRYTISDEFSERAHVVLGTKDRQYD